MPGETDITRKLYSEKAIMIATFFGGPVVAGYMMGENYKALNEEKLGVRSFVTGLLFSILMYAALFTLPDTILDSIPSVFIPAAYTFIVALIFHKYQKAAVLKHKENGGKFYSGWKAAGIGGLFLIVQIAVIFLFVYLVVPDFQVNTYDRGIEQFAKNETEALKAYDILQTGTKKQILFHLRENGIDLWQENLDILDNLDKIEGLPDELREQDALLRRYCNLRIVSYRILEKMVLEQTDKFAPKLDSLQNEIDLVLKDLTDE